MLGTAGGNFASANFATFRSKAETDKKAEEFDKALRDLRDAKKRLDDAATLYMERLEGRHGSQRNP